MLYELIDLLKEAGKIMLSAHDITNDVATKAGTANFVTTYDVAVQEFIQKQCRILFPHVHFIGEESKENEEALTDADCFLLDPIDGTTNFMHGYGHSAISLAFLSNKEVILGVVYNPYRDEMFYAKKGKGAFLNGNPLSVSDHTLENALVCFGTSPYHREWTEETFELIKKIYSRSRDIRRSGSAALDLCNVAAGRCDLFFEVILSPWDYAAGSLLITEAGGKITTFAGDCIRFDQPCSIFAANARIEGDTELRSFFIK